MLHYKREHNKCGINFQLAYETDFIMQNHRSIGWKGPLKVQLYTQLWLCLAESQKHLREELPTSLHRKINLKSAL